MVAKSVTYLVSKEKRRKTKQRLTVVLYKIS